MKMNAVDKTKIDAVATLRALAQKKTIDNSTQAAVVQTQDPAIAGAKKEKGSGSTVVLGFDPAISETALLASQLHSALAEAESNFKVVQGKMRDYGAGKRGLFNNLFKADITSVKVPFTAQTPSGPETGYVTVSCTNRFSVEQETIKNNRDEFGEFYNKLFVEETKTVLKPNADELVRGILQSAGMEGEELESAMETLFETETKVKTAEKYEREVREVPENLKVILDMAVTRAAPSLKFG